MILYMKVTKDKYELPIAVAGTIRELAMMLGIRESSVNHQFYRQKKYGTKCGYVKVEIDDEEEDE